MRCQGPSCTSHWNYCILLAFGVPALSVAMGGLVTAIIIGAAGGFILAVYQSTNLARHGWPLSALFIGYLGITVYNYIQEEK